MEKIALHVQLLILACCNFNMGHINSLMLKDAESMRASHDRLKSMCAGAAMRKDSEVDCSDLDVFAF
jgi:hypothetical protein